MESDKKILRIAVRKFSPFENTVKKIWEKFIQGHEEQVSVEIVPLELSDLYRSTIAEEGLKNGDWDIAIINTDWIHEAYTSASVENLKPYLEEDSSQGFLEGWSPSLLSLQQFDDKMFGLPFHDGPECLVYRKDLFENKAEQQNFLEKYGKPLVPPKSWEEFQEVAEFFQHPENTQYGTAFAAFPDGHNTVFDFCLQLWTRGGQLLDKKGRVNIDTPAANRGLTFYREILNNSKAIHPGSSKFDSVQLGEAFARGEITMMVNWFGFASVCEVSNDSKVKGKVNVTTIPKEQASATASLNVYYLYVMGAGSEKKKVAWDFIKFAVNPENDKLLTLEGGIGCRKSTWKDPEVNHTIPYYHKLDLLHEHAKSLPQKSNWSQIASVIDEVVIQTANSKKSIEKILQEGQEKISLIDKQ